MDTATLSEIIEITDEVHYRPAISIIMPFEPKMSLKTDLINSLKIAADKAEQELQYNYPDEMNMVVMQKLTAIVRTLNFSTHKKSIAIYVSPVFEKILYLDIPVEEKITVGDSFEIQDLLSIKKQTQQYLVLMLSNRESRMYLGDPSSLARILSNTPECIFNYVNGASERAANFQKQIEPQEIITNKLLLHTDKTLDIILNTYPLPLFIFGTEKIINHFKRITKHALAVTAYTADYFEEITIPELKRKLQPLINNWEKIKEKHLLNQIGAAVVKNKVAAGIRNVWGEAMNRKGKLLLIEKNYKYAGAQGNIDEVIYHAVEPYCKFSCIKNLVDEVIEKVLENGGDVEFVSGDLLKGYQHIMLIKY
jgi:hypothetical protein